MVNTLQQRCHHASTELEVSTLFDEVNTSYLNGDTTYNHGVQLTNELIKRLRVVLGILYPLTFPSSPPPSTNYLLLEGQNNFTLEDGGSSLKLEA